MKRRLPSFYLFLLLGAVWFMFSGFPNNPPNGTTGGPGEGLCTNCHTGNNPNGYDGSISLTGLPATITPNMTYTITVTSSNPNGQAVRAGFQWVALNSSNTNSGSMAGASANSTITPSGGRSYHEHNPAQNFGAGTSVSWTVNWTAPTAGASDETISFYGASVIASGNSGSSGDLVVTTQTSGVLPGSGADPLSVSVQKLSDVSCSGGNDGSATAIVTGGLGPYTYLWDNGNTNQTATNLTAGSHSVTITDTQPLSSSGNVTINQPTDLALLLTDQNNINCNSPSGTATVSAGGGTPGYTYQWSSGSIGPTATNLVAGNNTVTVTDANQCTESLNVFINSNTTIPNVEAGSGQEINCTNSTILLNGSASGCSNCSFSWSTINGSFVSGQNTASPTVNSSGTYTLTVTNPDNGCSASDMTQVTEDTATPVANAGSGGTINCSNNSLVLNGSVSNCNNCILQWSTSDGNIVSGQNSADATVDAGGTYTFTATAGNGCADSGQVIVIDETALPTVDAGSGSTLTCSTISLVLSGSVSNCTNCLLAWATADGNIVSGPNTANPTIDMPGTYEFTATNMDNGCSATDMVSISEDTNMPVADAGQGATLTCNITEINLNGVANNCDDCSFAWATTDGNITSGQNSTQATVNLPGTYSLTVTDQSSGCSSTDMVSVMETTPVSVSLENTTVVSCNAGNDGTATVMATAGSMPYTYAWSSGGSDSTESGLEAGPHTVTVTDNDGCTAELQINIEEPTALTANAQVTGESASGAMDGTATANPEGGVSPYSYLWSTGASSQTINDLAPDTYTLTITDDNGCTTTASVTVNSFECTISASITSTNVSCNGGNDGEATVHVLDATEPLTIIWSSGGTGLTESNLSSGDYNVSITDTNNCPTTVSVTITEPPLLILSLSEIMEIDCHGDSTGAINMGTMGGTAPYNFAWSNGIDTEDLEGIPAGTYTLTVTDNNGCVKENTVSVNEPELLEANLTSADETASDANDGTASANPTGGTPPYTYEWSNGGITSSIDNLAPDEYSVTVTDNNDCMFTGSAIVNSFECGTFVLSSSVTDTICPGNATGVISINEVIGALPPLQFAWSHGPESALVENLEGGNYTVTIMDAGNCSFTTNFEIIEADNEAPVIDSCPENINSNSCIAVITYNLPTAIDNCGDVNINLLEGLGSGAVFPDGVTTEIYELTDSSGNASICSFDITVTPDLSIQIDVINVSCHGESDGQIMIVPTGGTPPYTFEGSMTDLPANSYEITVTDAEGCEIIQTVNITEPPALSIEIESILPETDNEINGAATVSISGGTGNLSINWLDASGMVISTQESLTNVSAGIYIVMVSDENGCTSSMEITIDRLTPTFDISLMQKVQLSPNPSSGEFKLIVELAQAKQVNISIIDFHGKEYLNKESFSQQLHEERIDISNLAAGIYIIRVQVEDQVVFRKIILE